MGNRPHSIAHMRKVNKPRPLGQFSVPFCFFALLTGSASGVPWRHLGIARPGRTTLAQGDHQACFCVLSTEYSVQMGPVAVQQRFVLLSASFVWGRGRCCPNASGGFLPLFPQLWRSTAAGPCLRLAAARTPLPSSRPLPIFLFLASPSPSSVLPSFLSFLLLSSFFLFSFLSLSLSSSPQTTFPASHSNPTTFPTFT